MSVQVEKLEKSMAKLTIEVSAEELETALQKAYLKVRNRIQLPGFRKGKAPRMMIEKIYGAGVFYEDAANEIIPDAYAKAAQESGLTITSQPSIDITQIEKGKPFIFTAEVAVKPEVTLGEYKGLEIEMPAITVSEEEVDRELANEQQRQAREITVEDRPVQDGDIVKIDYEGFCDGVAFEGGKGTDYDLTIGSHSFIDTFEQQLIGKNIGDECEVNVTFPEQYHSQDLAGKPAVFKVAVKGIKVRELPELDDDFASEVSDFETLDEYREDIRKNLLTRKENAAKAEKEQKVVDLATANASMEVADAMVDAQAGDMMNNFAQRLQSQGMTLEQYTQYTGMTKEALTEQMKPQALETIRHRLTLEAIAKAEDIIVTDEEVTAELQKMADQYKMELAQVEEYMGEYGKSGIRDDLKVSKAIELLVSSAKVTEAAAAPAGEEAGEKTEE